MLELEPGKDGSLVELCVDLKEADAVDTLKMLWTTLSCLEHAQLATTLEGRSHVTKWVDGWQLLLGVNLIHLWLYDLLVFFVHFVKDIRWQLLIYYGKVTHYFNLLFDSLRVFQPQPGLVSLLTDPTECFLLHFEMSLLLGVRWEGVGELTPVFCLNRNETVWLVIMRDLPFLIHLFVSPFSQFDSLTTSSSTCTTSLVVRVLFQVLLLLILYI